MFGEINDASLEVSQALDTCRHYLGTGNIDDIRAMFERLDSSIQALFSVLTYHVGEDA